MAATRAAIYSRVSSDEQIDGYSLDAQTRATRHYAGAHEWSIVAEYRDEGRSARSEDLTKRPAFVDMLQDAENGLFDVIIIHKLDRFSRNLRITLKTLERLNRSNVAFVSISENMDFSTPIGKVILATLGAFAQYYSDNLSHETKKGKTERKRQGFYNGLLPFGVKKNDDGLAVPDPDTYPGLLLAYKSAADSKTDRDVAVILNEAGYRTTGNRGPNPFTKDTVRRILLNRFYLGELPDGNGGWLPAKHAPMLDAALFDAAQVARAANRHSARKTPRSARVYSLSGIGVCVYCGGRMHIFSNAQGRPRLHCYHGRQGEPCGQRATFLDVYEDQLAHYLETFHIPEDYERQIATLYAGTQDAQEDGAARRRQIESRLDRIKELYGWGDMDRDAYQQERDRLQAELAAITNVEDLGVVLTQTAALLGDLAGAWRMAGQEERNALARLMFDSVEINNKTVEAVTPRPEFAPFFVLDCQQRGRKVGSCGSDGLRSRCSPLWIPFLVPMPKRGSGRYTKASTCLDSELWSEIQARHTSGESLRDLARDYGVSYEAIRGIVQRSIQGAA